MRRAPVASLRLLRGSEEFLSQLGGREIDYSLAHARMSKRRHDEA